MRLFLKIISVSLVLMVGGYFLFPSPTPKHFSRNTPSFVKVISPQQETVFYTVSSLGTAIPSQTVTVRSQVSGVLVDVFFQEGQWVKKGDVLAKIDDRNYQMALTQAKGNLAQNQAKLAHARQNLKRYQQLFKQDSIAKQELDAQFTLLSEYEANDKSLQAAVEQAQLNLNETTIISPLEGRLGLRLLDVGNLLMANSAEGLVKVSQTHPMDISFSIPERYISDVAKTFYAGESLTVQLWDKQQLIKTGTLQAIDNQLDPTTGAVHLKARVENQDHGLFPQQFLNVVLMIKTIPNAIVIDEDAIQHGVKESIVYLVNDDQTVKKQVLKLGVLYQGKREVIEGLSLSDKVVIEGIDRLRDGMKVEIIP